ncbi:MAG: hypothetical protein ACLQFR_02360 [Streptosporangiaceae bacterium]
MGLMDRVKAQAAQLAQTAQEAALEGKAKLDQAQTGRRGDALLRSLGAAVFADRTGRGTPDTQARIDKLIADISAHERETGLNLADSQPSVPQQSFPADPPSPFPGPAASTFPGAAPSPFPGAAPSTFPDAGATFFPGAGDTASAQMPSFFQSPEEPATPESGAASSFPPES